MYTGQSILAFTVHVDPRIQSFTNPTRTDILMCIKRNTVASLPARSIPYKIQYSFLCPSPALRLYALYIVLPVG